MLALAALGLITMYSAGFDHGTRFAGHGRNMLLGLVVLFVVAQVPPQQLMRFAVPLYTLGVVLLIATAFLGITKKGATRWLDLGMVIQPSEVLKIAVPLILAWWFQRREGQTRASDFVVALALLALPVGLILKQPDLGTAILVLSAGLYVMFFAGLTWRLIAPLLLIGAAGIAAVHLFSESICQPDVNWPMMRAYQKNRVCTLLDPSSDPLGKGFHIIQGMIAIGSGGLGRQGLHERAPRRTWSSFPSGPPISSSRRLPRSSGCWVASACCWRSQLLIVRGLMIAADAPTVFTRLLAGAITLSFFTYAFVNMGMVSGILPVVGVPLPFISYGGTAMVSLGLGLGILMSIAKSRRLMQS